MPMYKNKAHRLLFAVIVATVLLVGCKPSVPGRYIQPDDMADILYDYYVSKAMANQSDDYAFDRVAYSEATLKKHGVTRAEFDSSMVYYYTHADQLTKIYTTVTERIGDEAKRLGASVAEGDYSRLTANGDTANIWKDATAALLIPVAPYNRIDFAMKADSTFHRGDSFSLNCTTDFMFQSGTKDLLMYVAVTYKNDSIAASYTHVSYSGTNSLRIPANDDDDIKEIRGFIYLAQGSDNSSTQKLLFLSNIHFIRFHKVESKDAGGGNGKTPDGDIRTGNSVATVKKDSSVSPQRRSDTVQLRPLPRVGQGPKTRSVQ